MPYAIIGLLITLISLNGTASVQVDDAVSQPRQAVALPDKTLQFCGDKAGWPPYTFIRNGEAQGYDLDVLQAILSPQNVRFQVVMLPWRRCLEMVRSGQMDVALSASGNRHRQRIYRMTRPYYAVTPSYVYPAERFPEGIPLTADDAAARYKVCGLRGYSYHSFGFTGDNVEQTTNNFRQLFNKVAAGRCDLMVARYEILQGFGYIAEPLLTPDWAHTPLPGIASDKFHMLVSRNIGYSRALQSTLDQGIEQLRREGRLSGLLEPYLRPDQP